MDQFVQDVARLQRQLAIADKATNDVSWALDSLVVAYAQERGKEIEEARKLEEAKKLVAEAAAKATPAEAPKA